MQVQKTRAAKRGSLNVHLSLWEKSIPTPRKVMKVLR